MRTHRWLIALVISTVTPLAAGEPLKLRLPQPAAAPANMLIQVSVEPNADNRSLQLVIDSEGYYRSSEVPIEGDKAGRTHTFEFRNLPTGSYEIRAVLVASGGKPRAFADGRTIVY